MEMKSKKKKSLLKRWWFWVSVIIVIVGIAGYNGSKDEPKKVGETKPAASSASSSTSTPKAKIFKVGDIVELKDLKVTVNKVYEVVGDQYTKPKNGNEFLAIDCTVENISKENQTVSSIMMFKVVDKDGRACEYSITGVTAAKAGQLDGDVGAGRKLTGVYVVEVPKAQKGLELEFNNSFLAGSQIIVQLN